MVVSRKEKMNVSWHLEASEDQPHAFVVAGVTSGAGKTSLAEALTRILSKRYATAAAKITVTHGELGCPHGGKGCNVCSSLGGDYQLITRASIIKQPSTDTARLAEAGAYPVIWAITREMFIASAWRDMKSLVKDAKCMVIESNSLALTIRPALTLMVVDPTVSRRLWKPSAERLITSADLLVFNDHGPKNKRQALLEEIETLRGSTHGLLFVAHPHDIERHSDFVTRLEEACVEIPG
jgi:Ni2+-binding GTPase involved in maturation of urease and hydrogenase